MPMARFQRRLAITKVKRGFSGAVIHAATTVRLRDADGKVHEARAINDGLARENEARERRLRAIEVGICEAPVASFDDLLGKQNHQSLLNI